METCSSLNPTALYFKKVIHDQEIALWIKRQLSDGMKLQSITMSINHDDQTTDYYTATEND